MKSPIEDLANTPGMEPPAGHVPEFDAPFNALQIGAIIAFAVTYAFATAFVGLRWFQGLKLARKIELDLVIITISYGVALVYFVTMINCFKLGWGKHLYDVSKAKLTGLNEAILPNNLSYLICPGITKLAILSVLYRINPSHLYRYAVLAVAIAIFAYTLTLCAFLGGPCNPLKLGTLRCMEDLMLAGAVLNIASDLAVIALPIPTIHNLQLKLKQKLTIGCLMGLGSGVVVCSIARLPYVIHLRTSRDSSWTQAIVGIWSIIELNLGIICACAMRLRRLIRTYLPRLALFSTSRTRSRGLSHPKMGMGYDFERHRFCPAGSRGQHSYQLHSVQRGTGQRSGMGMGGGEKSMDISVYREFDVDVNVIKEDLGTRGGNGSGTWYAGSAETILTK